jgi:hypothetical protein
LLTICQASVFPTIGFSVMGARKGIGPDASPNMAEAGPSATGETISFSVRARVFLATDAGDNPSAGGLSIAGNELVSRVVGATTSNRITWPVVALFACSEDGTGKAPNGGVGAAVPQDDLRARRNTAEVDDDVEPLRGSDEQLVQDDRRTDQESAVISDHVEAHHRSVGAAEAEDQETRVGAIEDPEAIFPGLDGQLRPSLPVDDHHVPEKLGFQIGETSLYGMYGPANPSKKARLDG